MRSNPDGKRPLATLAALALLPGMAAATSYQVTLDTSALSGLLSIVFDLFDGDGVANNQVVLDQFDFGGGGPSGAPTVTCSSGSGAACTGVSGDLSGTVTMDDSADFFNEFEGPFSPGSFLLFSMEMTDEFALGSPDSFAMLLLDSSGNPIPTTDPFGTDSLFSIEMGRSPAVETFESPGLVPEPILTTVPVPGTAVLVGISLLALGLARCNRRGFAQEEGVAI